MEAAKVKFGQACKLCDKLNENISAFLGADIHFTRAISTPISFRDGELCFNQLVSWIYILLIEEANQHIHFLKRKRFARLGVSKDDVFDVSKMILSLRTVLQHNTEPETSKTDREKHYEINEWFNRLIGNNRPNNNGEWLHCVHKLLNELITILDSLNDEVLLVSKNEHSDIIANEWRGQLNRDFPSHEYAVVVNDVLTDFGLSTYIDSAEFTRQYISNWKRELQLAPDGFIFLNVARRLIESAVLKHEYCPVGGLDIISLGVPPGRKVKELIGFSRESFYNSPCSKEDLLQRVVERLSSE